MKARLRRLPIAVLVGGLWAVLSPSDRWTSGFLGGIAVLVLPELQPWISKLSGRTGEPLGFIRRGGGWLAGTVTPIDGGGVRWRSTIDMEPMELRISPELFTFAGYVDDQPTNQDGKRYETLDLRSASGAMQLALEPEMADRVAPQFRIARSE